MVDTSDFAGSLPARGRQPMIVGEGFTLSMIGIEMAVIVGCSLLSGIIYHRFAYGEVSSVLTHAEIGVLAALCFLVVQNSKRRYDPGQIATGRKILRSVAVDWTVAWVALLLCAFLTKTTAFYSRGALMLFYVSGLASLALLHVGASVFLRRAYWQGLLAAKKVLLVGTMDRIRRFQEQNTEREHGIEVAGICVLPNDLSDDRRFDEILDRAVKLGRHFRVCGVVCLLPWNEERLIERCTAAFLSLPATIHLGTAEVLTHFRDLRVASLGNTLCLELVQAPLSFGKRMAKRLLDLATAVTALLLLWPVLLIAAIAIKLDSPGPVFFLQRRYGFNNEVFRIFKFRTMTTTEDGASVRQATPGDARITRVGRYLRRWNIDELPQLLNVIAGSMSVVGPRPHAMSHNHEFERRIALYARRHNVKPGITGWAQVNGFRGITDTDEKIESRVTHDLYYIDNWSFGFDLYIMALTVLSPRSYLNAL